MALTPKRKSQLELLDKYDVICLFSSDSDFASLLNYLKTNKKKVILVKGGYAQYSLVKHVDLVVNAQKIKKYITFIKQKSRL